MFDHHQTNGTSSPDTDGTRQVRAGRAWRVGAMAAAVALLAVGTAACGSDNNSGGSVTSGSGSGSSSVGASPEAGSPSGTGTSSGTGSSSATGGDGASDASGGQPSDTRAAGSASSAAQGSEQKSAVAASRCTADHLGLSLSPPDAGAGNIRYNLTLTNKGTSACTLQGFPGVSLLAGDGTTIGKPADREGEALGAVRLAPGGTADVTLHTLNRGIKGTSCWEKPSLLKVYPPGSKEAMTLSTSSPTVCGDTFRVTAVRAD
ncbi:DUF4232 domain-containing protein [Streptomyces sp. NPDC088116]|uniref:DUF4232 domain-containing protein n=1 Tax=Streptomyces sp. NPDC088116 TaxID=3365825 RepID=UPI003812AEAD